MNTKGPPSRRLQSTYGHGYHFGPFSPVDLIPDEDWPSCLPELLGAVKQWLPKEFQGEAEAYNGVHVNWYQGGMAGIARHSDDEEALVPGLPIISVTWLEGLPRPFYFYRKPESKTPGLDTVSCVREVALGDGDVLVMGPGVQRGFEHSINPTKSIKWASSRRINFTIRAFRDRHHADPVDPNPPNLRCHEPEVALFAANKGLAGYQAIANGIAMDQDTLLEPWARLVLEVGAGQAKSVEAVVAQGGWVAARTALDAQRVARCLVLARGPG